MKNKNTKKLAAGVLAAAIVVQNTAMTALPSFADTASPAAETADPVTPPAPTEATQAPTEAPTQAATEAPTQAPTQAPTEAPTQAATEAPTQAPTPDPTEAPPAPTQAPTEAPTQAPTQAPTEAPTQAPVQDPTQPAISDTLTLSGGTSIPATLEQGAFLIVKGQIASAESNITSVNVGVFDANGTKLSGGTAQPDSKSYDLNRLDRYVVFDKLACGDYVYKVTASNAANTNAVLAEISFTVTGSTAAADTLLVSGGSNIPAEIKVGGSVDVKGTLSSGVSAITSVSVGIYDESGNKLSGGTASPNAKSYDLSAMDEAVAFDKLSEGVYTYKVIASNSGNANCTVVNQIFRVVGTAATADNLTISNVPAIPATLTQGNAIAVTGTVTSASSDITSLSVGIYTADGVLISGSTIAPKVKSYDLRRLDNEVSFSNLAPGKYIFSVTASNAANTNFGLVSKEFTVTAPSAASDTLTISGVTQLPATLNIGQAVNVIGTVTSGVSNITSLTVGVYDNNGKFVTGKTVAPNAKSYNLKNLDAYVAFDRLAAGNYTFAVIATNAGNQNYALVNKNFTVGTIQGPVNDTLSITDGTVIPDNLALGKALNVTGTVTSASSNITALTVAVYSQEGQLVTGRSIAPNAKTYDLKRLDAYVAFNKLEAGKYVYAVIASNAANTNFTLVNKKFTVGNGETTPPAEADKLTISGATTVPDSMKAGTTLKITGTVSSGSTNITSLTCGVYDANGKLVTGKTVAPNAKTFDLKNLDADVAFNTLADGYYTFAVTAANSAGSETLVSKKFTVGFEAPAPAEQDALTLANGTNMPENLKIGQAVNVVGTVTSESSNISSLTVAVYDAEGKFITGKTVNPNAKSYDLKALDADVAFNKLPTGSYTYAVIATNSGNLNYALVNKRFTVGDVPPAQTSSDTLTITGGTSMPDNIAVNQVINVKGVVTSASSNMTALTCGVYDSNGKFVTGRTINPNAKSYDLKNLDAYVAFNKLTAGNYTYAVIASNAANTNFTLVNKKFTVGNGGTPGSAVADALTISGGTSVPDTLAKGKALNVTGVVTSAASNITALTCGVYDSAGKFVTGRTINPNAKSYDLKNVDAYVAFNKLSEGTYTYAVIATNAANKDYALVNKKFTVGSGSQTPSTNDALTITGGTSVPDTLAKGKALNITGTVTSANSNITSLTCGVYDSVGKFVTGRTINPNAKTYNLKNLDAYVTFNKLSEGSYTYAVIATNSGNTNYALVNKKFNVGGGSSTGTDALTISGGTVVPDNVSVGKALAISGTVTSANSNMTSLTCGVYDSNGKFVTGRTINPNAKTYNLRNLDSYVQFNKLPAGSYTYAVIASNAANTNYALVNKSFTVGGSGNQTPSNGSDALTITGGTAIPDTLAAGKALAIRGTVTSASSNMTSLTCGVYDSNGKFVTGRTINPNAKTYDLKKLDSYVAFNSLPAGNYVYAVIATNSANKNYALVNKSFTISSTGGTVSDPLTISGSTTVPGSLSKGKGVAVRGTITSSSSNITSVTVGVYDASGKMVTGDTVKPGSKTYNVSALDSAVRFDKLGTGTYYYKVTASNSVNTGYTLVNQSFNVR